MMRFFALPTLLLAVFATVTSPAPVDGAAAFQVEARDLEARQTGTGYGFIS